MAERHPEPKPQTQEYYIVRGVLARDTAFQLAEMALKRMFDHKLLDTSVRVPIAELETMRVFYTNGLISKPEPLTPKPLVAALTAETDSVTLNTSTDPFGSISLMGAIEITDTSEWDTELAGLSLDDVHAGMAILYIEARQRASGLWHFEANTL